MSADTTETAETAETEALPTNPFQLPFLESITYGEYTLHVNDWLTSAFDDIGEAAMAIPAIVEWLSYVLQYYVQAEILDARKIKQAEATAYFRLRSGGFAEKYGEKMTESALEKAVELEEDVQKAVTDYAESKAWVARLRGTLSTFQSKLDLLRSTEATRRALAS